MNNLDQPAMPQIFNNVDSEGNYEPETIYHGFTKREKAAISLRVPMSGDEELDKMILAARRLDILERLVDGVAESYCEYDPKYADKVVHICVSIADALLKEAGYKGKVMNEKIINPAYMVLGEIRCENAGVPLNATIIARWEEEE